MTLPGMPFGRPCALAKTSARTRKHCNFVVSPLRTLVSDNVLSKALFSPVQFAGRCLSVSVYFTSIYPPVNNGIRLYPALFACFAGLQLFPRPSFSRLITSQAPSRDAPRFKIALPPNLSVVPFFNALARQMAYTFDLFPSRISSPRASH